MESHLSTVFIQYTTDRRTTTKKRQSFFNRKLDEIYDIRQMLKEEDKKY